MAITVLDPKTALLIIDLQKGIVSLPAAHVIAEVVKNAATLADAFRRLHLPVVLVNVDGRPPGRVEQARNLGDLPADWAELVPELNRQPTDHTVTKRTAGAFTNTGLGDNLKLQGVTQVVIAGVATSQGVEATARHAYELGFNVTLPIDAMTDLQAESHAHSVGRVFPRIGETGTTRDLLGLLSGIEPNRKGDA